MKRYFYGFLGAAVLGTGLHFLYEWLPNPLFGIIAPVNESAWEHLKLSFWPFLAGALAVGKRDTSFWGSVCLCLLMEPFCVLGLFYTVTAGFGIESLVVDIVIYYVTLFLGFALLCHLGRKHWRPRTAGVFIMLACLWAMSLVILSVKAPELPVFRG